MPRGLIADPRRLQTMRARGVRAGVVAGLVAALAGCGGSHTPPVVTAPVVHHTTTTALPAPKPAHTPPHPAYPKVLTLGNADVAYWAPVLKASIARQAADASSKMVSPLSTTTGDGTTNIVLVIGATEVSPTQTWYLVRLPILPNNSVGYVSASVLGSLNPVYTHLYVNRETTTATLTRNGLTVFTTRVGVGRKSWPTPPGQFYIRDELTDFNDPFYGPIAFGTSARSAVLTEWPDGGFVGVHGTNEPQLIPGRISHGCIRMNDSAIVKLARLMPVGTPLTVT